MNLINVANKLAAENCGVLGTSLFVTEMPDTCHEGILLMDAYYGTPVDHYIPGYYKTEFRIVVRSVDYSTGAALSKRAYAALGGHAGFMSGPLTAAQCLPLFLPRSYRRSVGGYWEFEVDMIIAFMEDDA